MVIYNFTDKDKERLYDIYSILLGQLRKNITYIIYPLLSLYLQNNNLIYANLFLKIIKDIIEYSIEIYNLIDINLINYFGGSLNDNMINIISRSYIKIKQDQINFNILGWDYTRYTNFNFIDVLKPYTNIRFDETTYEFVNSTTGGSLKSYEINDIYDYYYKIEDNNEIINDLLEIFNNDSSFIILLLYLIINNEITVDINLIFKNFINDLQLLLNDLCESDVILINRYEFDDIIFYIFMIYVYDRFNGLLSLSKKDIKITIKNDKLKLNIIENYHGIYKKLNDYFNGNEKYKFINYLKKYLQVNYTKPLNNSKYLLSFIYNNNSLIEGYDSFLTFAYINVLNKVAPFFYINGRKYENTLPTLNIYDLSDMKNVKLKMSQKQEKIVLNLLKDKKALLTLLLKRYEPRFITKRDTKFILNKQILDYLSNSSSLSHPLPIIDFDKYLNDDQLTQTPPENDDIETNLFYYSSLEGSNNVYVKLIKYYLLAERKHLNKKLLDFALYQICNINKTLDKSKIEIKLIKELSNANIEIDLKIIKDFIQPKCEIKMTEVNILDLLSYYYKKISYDTMIRYLSKLYEFDMNHRMQIQIQDYIEPLKLIKGGAEGEPITEITPITETTLTKPTISSQSSIYKLLPVNSVSDLESTIKKIVFILEKKLIKTDDIDKKIHEIINFNLKDIITIIDNSLDNNKKNTNKLIEKQQLIVDSLSSTKKEKIKEQNQLISNDENSDAKIALRKEINQLAIRYDEQDKIKDKYTTDLINIEKGLEDIKDIKAKDKDLLFETFDDYKVISNKYTNLIDLLDIIKFIPNNNNVKDSILKIITEKQEKITKFKENLEKNKKDFDDQINTPLKTSNQKLKDFFNIISKIDNIDDGIIKSLKKTYINPDLLGHNEKDPISIIDEIGKINIKILEDYLNSIKYLSNTVYPNFISKISNERMRGGAKNNNKGGGKIDEYKKELEDKKKSILTDLDNISSKLKKFKGNQETNKNVETKMASVGFIDEAGGNVFDRLINAYDDNIKNKNMPYEVARNIFYSKANNLNLDPSVELEITQNDKGIFCAVVYVIRLLTLYICNLLIDNNKFTALTSILKSYVIWYIVILLIFVVIINIDAFKLRILINYLNMHVNSFGIIVHIILMLIFVYLIYLMTLNILGDDQPSLQLSDNEKIKLKYKLELLTAIVFIFICILVFII